MLNSVDVSCQFPVYTMGYGSVLITFLITGWKIFFAVSLTRVMCRLIYFTLFYKVLENCWLFNSHNDSKHDDGLKIKSESSEVKYVSLTVYYRLTWSCCKRSDHQHFRKSALQEKSPTERTLNLKVLPSSVSLGKNHRCCKSYE